MKTLIVPKNCRNNVKITLKPDLIGTLFDVNKTYAIAKSIFVKIVNNIGCSYLNSYF